MFTLPVLLHCCGGDYRMYVLMEDAQVTPSQLRGLATCCIGEGLFTCRLAKCSVNTTTVEAQSALNQSYSQHDHSETEDNGLASRCSLAPQTDRGTAMKHQSRLKMAPKRKTTRLNPDATPTPVTDTHTTTSVTNAQIQAMINEGVTAALAARDAMRNAMISINFMNGVRRPVVGARECTYSVLPKMPTPLNFQGTEGVLDSLSERQADNKRKSDDNRAVINPESTTEQNRDQILEELMPQENEVPQIGPTAGAKNRGLVLNVAPRAFQEDMPKIEEQRTTGVIIWKYQGSQAKVYAVGAMQGGKPDNNVIVTQISPQQRTRQGQRRNDLKMWPVVQEFPKVFPLRTCQTKLPHPWGLRLLCNEESGSDPDVQSITVYPAKIESFKVSGSSPKHQQRFANLLGLARTIIEDSSKGVFQRSPSHDQTSQKGVKFDWGINKKQLFNY
ncbi:hypothetical protein Tco_1328897 [Tanacetum coccineum]